MSIERMCAGKEFQVEVASNIGWSGKEICIGRTQGSGWKIVRNEFRQVDRLRGMKSFPGRTIRQRPGDAPGGSQHTTRICK